MIGMRTIYTMRPDDLLREADRLEREAELSINAWITIGQGDRYNNAMRAARMLRRAAAEQSTILKEWRIKSGYEENAPIFPEEWAESAFCNA